MNERKTEQNETRTSERRINQLENHTQNGISKLSEWNGEWKEENKKIKKLNGDNENDDDDFFFGRCAWSNQQQCVL